MNFFLIAVGVGFVVYGIWLIMKKEGQWDSSESMTLYKEQMEEHQLDFISQFRLTQTSIQSLYAEDFTELKQEMTDLKQGLSMIYHQLEMIQIEKSIEGLSLSSSKREQLIQVLSWSKAGKTNEEIAQLLNVGVGEVLLLKQLSK